MLCLPDIAAADRAARAGNASDEIAKFSRQTGFSAEAIQELQYTAERQGVGREAFNASVGAFSKRLGELRAGKGALAGWRSEVDSADWITGEVAHTIDAQGDFATALKANAR